MCVCVCVTVGKVEQAPFKGSTSVFRYCSIYESSKTTNGTQPKAFMHDTLYTLMLPAVSASHQHRSHSYKVSCTHNARSEYITIWTYHTMPMCSNHHVDGLCTKSDSNGIHRAECRTGVTAQKEPKTLQTVAC